MRNINSFYNKILLGNTDKIALSMIVILLVGFSYSIHFLFNRPVDSKVEMRIKEESESTNIGFDEDTIDEIIELKDYGRSLNPSTTGKNPFVTY